MSASPSTGTSRQAVPRLLEWGAAALALIGAALLLLPVTPSTAVRAPAVPSGPAPEVARMARDSSASVIVQTNLFSGSRRAPRERFRAPGTVPETDPLLAPALSGTLAADSLSVPTSPSGPQLFGIVVVDGQPRALVQIAADSVPRLVERGARIGAWRVGRIFADRVELQSSAGVRIVRLARRSSPDSVEHHP